MNPPPATRHPPPATRHPSNGTRHPSPVIRHPRKSPAANNVTTDISRTRQYGGIFLNVGREFLNAISLPTVKQFLILRTSNGYSTGSSSALNSFDVQQKNARGTVPRQNPPAGYVLSFHMHALKIVVEALHRSKTFKDLIRII